MKLQRTKQYHFLFILFGCLLYELAYTQELPQKTTPSNSESSILDTIITPDLNRREITEDLLDSENWELGAYAGIFTIEDFGSNPVVGLRLAYHLTENFSLESSFGTTEAKESSIEVLGGGIQLLSDDEREYSYYNISIVFNILPGEVFIGKKTAYNSGFYLLVGAGNTNFNNNDYFTTTIGGGLRFYLNDFIALHATVKDHIFDIDLIEDKQTHNIETSIGVSLFF